MGTVKRAIQKNLNINWSDTIRNALLFLFFGYFGIRKNDTFTKTIMIYYAAPLCFIIQLRFIKIFFKQIFYLFINATPAFVISLLPVPLQSILGFDVMEDCIKILYPDYYYYMKKINVDYDDDEKDYDNEMDFYDDDDDDNDDDYD